MNGNKDQCMTHVQVLDTYQEAFVVKAGMNRVVVEGVVVTT